MKILIISADRTTPSGHPQNIGDAFLTDALSRSLRDAGQTVLIADFGGTDRVESTENRVTVSGVKGLARVIRSVDAVLVGGGTLLADDQPDRPFAGLPRLCLSAALLARAQGKKFVIFGVGVDPVRRRRARLAISATLRLAEVWVRDSASLERAQKWMRRQAHLSGDVSLFDYRDGASRAAGDSPAGSPPAASPPAGETSGGAVLALNRREAAVLTVQQVDALRQRWPSVRFVSMDQGADSDGSSLAAPVAAALGFADSARSWQSVFDTIAAADVVIASRMHAMYMGVMAHVPVVAISGLAKVDAFAADFHVETAATIEEATSKRGRFDDVAVRAAVAGLDDAEEHLLEWLGGRR